ncbi:DUF397 domain-containing protein [Streptomyces sp. NPDC056500]|uniref:DUF397 domain-containing protein n=1 Tax=Streptomyces sp. NPDC056500 TaxID=3345840 RepID=UPI0036C80EF8
MIDYHSVVWTKSSYSGSSGGQCLEWAPGRVSAQGAVPVRDSKVADGPAISVTEPAWSSFVNAIKDNALSA